MDVEASDLGGNNTGSLTELCNLDKGLWVAVNTQHAGY